MPEHLADRSARRSRNTAETAAFSRPDRGPSDRYTRPIRTAVHRLVCCLSVVVILGACSDDEDPNGASNEAVLDVDDQTCLMVEGNFEPVVEELPVIDCDVPHTHEIIARVEDEEHEVYPGFAALETLAQRVCYTEFEPYVGVSPFDSSLFISWLVPTLDGWNGKDSDREILCVVGRLDAGQLDRSVFQTQL